MLLTTISLFNRDIKIAGAAGRIHVRNFKRARRHKALVNLIAILADDHLGIGPGDTTHHRGIALKGVGQHVIIGSKLSSPERNTVENICRGRTVTQCELRL